MEGTNSKEVLTSSVGVTKFQKLAELCVEQQNTRRPCCNLSQILCISQLARLSIRAAQAARQAHAVGSISVQMSEPPQDWKGDVQTAFKIIRKN